MNWEQIIPIGQGKRHTAADAQKFVRASFSKVPEKKHKVEEAVLRIYIGTDITTRLQILRDDSIDFFVDTETPKKWLIKKAARNSTTGFKRMDIAKTPPTSLIFQLTWRNQSWIPTEEEYGIKRIPHTFEYGGIVVNFGQPENV